MSKILTVCGSNWFPALRFVAGGSAMATVVAWSMATAFAASPAAAEHRARLELANVPEKPAHMAELLRQLKKRPQQGATSELNDVTVVGQIGGMPNPWRDTHPDFPWFAGQGSFFLLDSNVAEQFAHHAKHHSGNHNCAFCQRLAEKNAHSVAVVNLVDEAGKIVPIDSRELFPLEEGQSVVIHGRAELLGGAMLVIHADGLHVGQ